MSKCDLELNDALAHLKFFQEDGELWADVTRFVSDLDGYVGIDPGRNYGCIAIFAGIAYIGGKTMEKGDPLDYGYGAFQLAQVWSSTQLKKVIIEGASYKDQYGQVGLAEIRFGFYLPFRLAGVDVEIVPPATIRKAVFGHGNCRASEIWPNLNPNSADALGAALFAAGYRCEKDAVQS